VAAELYEGLLMLQHRGQDSAGMVTTDWSKFVEHKSNGLVRDVFGDDRVMSQMHGELHQAADACCNMPRPGAAAALHLNLLFRTSSCSHTHARLLN
jgi:glutamine phosphoribosylpyrophosphate amidotransferase